MTALNTPIVFNNSTGSDSQMSGSPSTRIIPSTLTLQITSGSNVAYGGSSGPINVGDLVYAPNQTSGRKFNVVASINTSVSPTEYTFDNNWDASDINATCYSGGKRATFDNADSRIAFKDCVGKGWEFETETNQTVSSVVSVGGGAVDSRTIVKGSTGSEVVTQTANTYTFGFGDYYASPSLDGTYITFGNLQFENTSSLKSSAYCFRVSGNYGRLYSIKLMNQTNNHQGLLLREAGHNDLSVENCVIRHCVSHGVDMNRIVNATFEGCYIADNGGHGINSNRTIKLIHSCLIANNANDGVDVNDSTHVNSIYYGNGGSGISAYYFTPIIGCVFYNNSAYGINYQAGQTQLALHSNAFGANTSGATSGSDPYETNNITLQADPFVDAANGDFNLNNNLGGGSVLRATKYTLGG